jgi:modulator of FtsH protease
VFPYDPSEWTDLFVAGAGAGAALAGLVFVAVSINIERILKLEGVAERALATVLLLLAVVIVSITGLIPGQSRTALGLELLLEGLFFAALITRLSFASLPDWREHLSWLSGRLVVAAIGTVPIAVGGASLLAESGGGLYWVAGGIVGAIAGGVATAWVLLVEILR